MHPEIGGVTGAMVLLLLGTSMLTAPAFWVLKAGYNPRTCGAHLFFLRSGAQKICRRSMQHISCPQAAA